MTDRVTTIDRDTTTDPGTTTDATTDRATMTEDHLLRTGQYHVGTTLRLRPLTTAAMTELLPRTTDETSDRGTTNDRGTRRLLCKREGGYCRRSFVRDKCDYQKRPVCSKSAVSLPVSSTFGDNANEMNVWHVRSLVEHI